MSLLEKQTEHVKSEQIRTGQACAQKSAHAPRKRREKKAAIGTDCKRIENDTLINQA
jgi:hypothetical protein